MRRSVEQEASPYVATSRSEVPRTHDLGGLFEMLPSQKKSPNASSEIALISSRSHEASEARGE